VDDLHSADNKEQTMPEDQGGSRAPVLSARVAGHATIFPRGFIWQFPVWYAIMIGYLVLAVWPPLWFRASAAAGLLGAMITALTVLASLSLRAFTADETGVTLGLPATTKRRGRSRRSIRHLSWDQVERIRLKARRGGTRVEIFLSENAPASMRPVRYPPAERALRAASLLIPFWYLRRPTGLLTPLDGPPRYRAAIAGMSLDEFRRALRAIVPAEITIVVLIRRGERPPVSSPTAAHRTA
jgi:hypothetical protein